jgi:hypothetical protein
MLSACICLHGFKKKLNLLNMMMKKQLLIGTFLMAGIITAMAQDEPSFTDEDLTKYASVMVWAEQEKNTMSDSVNIWVKSNEKLSTSTYNELSRASKDAGTDDVEATEEEKAVFNQIQQNIETQKESFKETYVGKIKNDIGAGLYNNLRKKLRTDKELTTRYDSIYQSLLTATEGTDENDNTEVE